MDYITYVRTEDVAFWLMGIACILISVGKPIIVNIKNSVRYKLVITVEKNVPPCCEQDGTSDKLSE